ncbi:carboxymuconolactone decarboxylase family protein [Flavivirga eckloniae]
MLISLISSQANGCHYYQAHMANLSRIYKASKEKIESVLGVSNISFIF